MGRVHLFELHDQPWFPAFLRDHVTDALQFLLNFGAVYRPIVPLLTRSLNETRAREVLDLCSGAGGPWPWLEPELRGAGLPPLDICLTDKYPHAHNRERMVASTRIRFLGDPVDATCVPASLPGFRTIFNSFHHFRPGAARAILGDAVRNRRPIAIFEAPGRYLITLLLVLFLPIPYFLSAPFLRPFSWSRIFFTYLFPVIPFVLVFDGIVSCLRIYSPHELRALVASVPDSASFQWQIGVARGGALGVPITYLIGSSAAPSPTTRC